MSVSVDQRPKTAIGIALDPQGNVYISGYTATLVGFPTAPGAFQTTLGGGTCAFFEPCGDAFVAKISVGGPGVTPAIHLEITSTDVPAGGTLTATWGGIPAPSSRDELVLYPLGESADDTNAVAAYPTTGAATGSLPLTIPGTMPQGTYELRLLTPDPRPEFNSLLVVVARSEPVYVSNGATFTVTPTSAAPGATLTVSWSDIVNPTATDWIALYSHGTVDVSYLDWMYVSCSKTPSTARASGSCGFVLPANLTQGTYELRLFSNNSFSRLGTSEIDLHTAVGLTVAPTPAPPGGTVTATWSGIANPTATDWIGLYAQSAADAAYLDWVYVSCTKAPSTARGNGSCAIVLPSNLTAGAYELRLFSNGGFTRLAGIALSVGAAGPSLSVSPTSSPPGGTVTATCSRIVSPTAGDWIGLYAQGAADTAFVDWMYVSCSKTAGASRASGSCALVLPTNPAQATYELRLFANNAFTRLATSAAAITVGSAGPTVAVSPTSTAPGGPVTATWSGIVNPAAGDWIGLFAQGAADTAFVDWIYVICSKTAASARPSGSCSMTLPTNLASGTYELRLLANNTFTRLATSNAMTVGAAGPTLGVNPTSAAAGGSVTVSWTGITNPTAGDWIGLYAQGSADTGFIDWMYVSCSKSASTARASGSCTLALPGSLALGTYELRLFANNGFTRLATSSALTVR